MSHVQPTPAPAGFPTVTPYVSLLNMSLTLYQSSCPDHFLLPDLAEEPLTAVGLHPWSALAIALLLPKPSPRSLG